MSSISSSELSPPFGWSATADSSSSTLSQSQTDSADLCQTKSVRSQTEYDGHCSLVLDSTTLDAGFDIECLDGLDDLLLLSPFEAFTTVCWDTVIHVAERQRPRSKAPHKSDPKPSPPLPRTRKSQSSDISRGQPEPLVVVPEIFSEESEESGYESDSDELRTLDEDTASRPPSLFPSPYDTGFHLNHQPTVEPITLIKYSCLPYEIDPSFVLFEPQHTINYHCEDGIGLSSFNAEQRKSTKVNRIASFCANLPTRLLRAAS